MLSSIISPAPHAASVGWTVLHYDRLEQGESKVIITINAALEFYLGWPGLLMLVSVREPAGSRLGRAGDERYDDFVLQSAAAASNHLSLSLILANNYRYKTRAQ